MGCTQATWAAADAERWAAAPGKRGRRISAIVEQPAAVAAKLRQVRLGFTRVVPVPVGATVDEAAEDGGEASDDGDAGGSPRRRREVQAVCTPVDVLVSARALVENPNAIGSQVSRPAIRAVHKPNVQLEHRLPVVGGANVDSGDISPDGRHTIERQLVRASMLTEVEVVATWQKRPPRFELFVNSGASPVQCCLVQEEGNGRAQLVSGVAPRYRLQLVEPRDNVRHMALRVFPNALAAGSPVGPGVEVRQVVPIGLPAGSPPPKRRLLRPPAYWAAAEGTIMRRVDLGAPEHVEVFQRLLDETWKAKATRDRADALPRRLAVRKVQRVVAPVLWNRFARCRRRVARAARGGATAWEAGAFGAGGCTPIASMGGGAAEPRPVKTARICDSAPELFGPRDETAQEHYLFHGTSPAGALGIIREGFDMGRSLNGRPLLFGPGAYFAEASSKFDEYARPDEFSGLCAVLVCRVLCGEMHRALRKLDAEFVLDEDFAERYDGVLGDREACVGTYREFVVFQEDQIYPEYIVFYDREL